MKIRVPLFWRKRWSSWLDRRIPPQNQLTLTQREIFIFLSRQGWLFLVVTLLILVAAFNYQNNMGLLLAFTLLSLGLLAMFATFRNVRGLTLKALNAAPVFVGESARFTVQLTSGRTECEAIGLGTDKNVQCWNSVPAHGFSSAVLALATTKRGVQSLPRLYLCSHYPFGWFRVWSWPHLLASVVVYPQPIAPEFDLPKHGGAGDDGQEWERGSEDFHAHRNYQPGDSARQIDWKVFARERGLLVREFVTPSGGECRFRLRDLPSADLELKLCWLSYLLCEAERNGVLYALELDDKPMPVANGDLHLAECLEALARF